MGPTMPSIASVSNIFLYLGASPKALELHAQVVYIHVVHVPRYLKVKRKKLIPQIGYLEKRFRNGWRNAK